MTIILRTIRHGLTQANLDRVCGSVDDVLSDQGRQQAVQARRALEGRDLGSVLSSPLARAMETAHLVTGQDASDIEAVGLLREREFGELAGLSHEEAKAKLPDVTFRSIRNITYSINPHGGETLEQLRERADQFVSEIRSRPDGSHFTAFTHGNLLQQIRGSMLGVDAFACLDLPLEGILNLAMMTFELDRDGRCISHDVEQLAPNDGVRGLY